MQLTFDDIETEITLSLSDGDRVEINQPDKNMASTVKYIPLLSPSGRELRTQKFKAHVVRTSTPFQVKCSQCKETLLPSINGLGQNHEFLQCSNCKSYLDPSREHTLDSPLPDFTVLKNKDPWENGYPKFNTLGEMSQEGLSAINKIYKIFRSNSINVPPVLYHYASSETFTNIINNKALWLTSISEMNDRTEGNYGISSLQSYLGNHHSDLIDQFDSDDEKTSKERFAFCFCEGNDVLGQWREYGNRGEGMALGFDTKALAEGNLWLVKLIYEIAEQNEILEDVFEIAIPFLTPNHVSNSDGNHISMAIKQEASLLFKHPAFRDEREWRVIKNTTASDSSIRYRAGSFGPVPYIETTKEDNKNWDMFPLTHVMSGPSPKNERSRINTMRYLETQQLGHIQVDVSKIPLR